MHECTGRTHYGLARARKLDFTRQDVEGLVPVVTMQRRTHSRLTLDPGDLVGLCGRVRSQHCHPRAEYIQWEIVVLGSYNKRLRLHDVFTSSEEMLNLSGRHGAHGQCAARACGGMG